MTTTDRITTLDYLLLGILKGSAMSGYDIRKLFVSSPLVRFSASPGSVYPSLRRLEQRGLVRGRIHRPTTLRPRKVFRVTIGGVARLKEWVTRPIEREDIIHRLDDLVIRFSLMDELVTPRTQVAFLKQMAHMAIDYAREIRRHREKMEAHAPPNASLALTLGEDAYRMHARWALRAARHLEPGQPATQARQRRSPTRDTPTRQEQ